MNAHLTGITAFAAVFGTGVLASLSPCVYPLIPITLGFFGTQAGESKKRGVMAYALGQIIAFLILGAVAVFAEETLGFTSESRWVNVCVGLVLLASGWVSWSGKLPTLPRAFQVSRYFPQASGKGFLGAFVLGAGSALVASPCTSPLLAGVLALMAESGTFSRGLILMLFYAVGFSSLFVLLGLGALNLRKLPRAGQWMNYLHKLGAAALLIMGVFFIFKVYT